MQDKDCLFCKISSGQFGTEMLYEDAEIVAFHDIDPQSPVHLLIVPKDHIKSAAELGEANGPLLGKIYRVAKELCDKNGVVNGYRVVTNIGKEGGQSVDHLHFHVLGGRQLGWPPG